MADLIFVEHASQVDRVRTALRSARIVALAPEAMDALDRARLPYRRPEQYLETTDLNAAGRATYQQVRSYCRGLDEWLRDRAPVVDRVGISPATLFYYEFKILADTVTLRAAELQAIIRAERPTRVIAFPSAPEAPDAGLTFRRASAYACLLPAVTAETGVALKWDGDPSSARPPYKDRAQLRGLVPARWRQRLAHFRSAGVHSLRRQAGADGGTVLLVNATPDIRAVMRSSSAAAWRFVHWAGNGQPMTLQPLGRGGDLRVRARSASALVRNDAKPPVAGLAPEWLEGAVRPRVEGFVRRDVANMAASAAATSAVVDHYQPAVALAGILAGAGPRAAAARARAMGVPVVLYQHGGSYGYLDVPIHYYNDLMHADALFTYGEGVTTALGRRFGSCTPCAEMMSVGSAALAAPPPGASDRTRARRQLTGGSTPVVVYAATCMMGQRFYAPHYRSCEYFALLTEAMAALNRAEGVTAVLKVHQRADNCFNPIAEWCRRNAPKVRVVEEGSFDAWLDAADLVVLDLPATPLLEALVRGARVLAYCDERAFPVDAAARSLLSAAVRLETDRGRFIASLERPRDWIAQPVDRSAIASFVEQFATGADAASRAASALATIGGRRPALATA